VKIKSTIVFEKNFNSKKRNIVNEGSARSSKTISICQVLIARMLEKKRMVTICREKSTWLKSTAMLDFYDVLTNHFKIYNPKFENKTDKTYTFENGSFVRFIGTDEHQKLRGMKQDLAWLNEGNEISYESYRQISIRTGEQIFIDLNPSMTQHWIFDNVLLRDDSEHIHSTYKDNPFLERALIEEIERLEPTDFNIQQGTADEVLWKIYGLGLRASHQGQIFDKIKICKELPPENEWKKTAIGLDFGFTHDPSAIVRMVLSQGALYFDEIAYKRGLLNTQNRLNPAMDNIETILRDNIKPNERIWADAAEPKSIRELQLCGFNIQAATKGADSVLNGINLIKSYNCFITERSVNLIKEKNNYVWAKDKQTGNLTNKPVDAYNHGFDAASYVSRMELPEARNKPYKALIPQKKLFTTKSPEDIIRYYEHKKKYDSNFN
jgi:phage terminase large subunit